MNYALFRAVALLAERPHLTRAYKRSPGERAGGELLAMLDSIPDDAASDRVLADRWSERLGIQGWFEWRAIDELPTTAQRAW